MNKALDYLGGPWHLGNRCNLRYVLDVPSPGVYYSLTT